MLPSRPASWPPSRLSSAAAAFFLDPPPGADLSVARPSPVHPSRLAVRRRGLLHRSAARGGFLSLPASSAARGRSLPAPSAALYLRRPLGQGPLPGTSSADPCWILRQPPLRAGPRIRCSRRKSAPADAVADRAADLRRRCSRQPLFNSASAPRTSVNSSKSGCSGLFGLRSPVLPDFD